MPVMSWAVHSRSRPAPTRRGHCASRSLGEAWFPHVNSAVLYAPPVSHRVTLIPGDGTGPEIAEATRRVLKATGVAIDWDAQEAGADVMDRHGGNPLPDQVIESIRRNGTAIKGPITTPI